MIQPVQATAPIAPVAPIQPVAWPLPAMTQGTSVAATVVARLTTGEVRVSLLGQLLDLMPSTEASATLEPGDTVTLSVLISGQQPVLGIARVDRPAARQPLAERSASADQVQQEAGPDGGGAPGEVIWSDDADAPAANLAGRAQSSTIGASVGLGAPQEETPEPTLLPQSALRAAVAAALPTAAAVQTGLAPLLADAKALLAAGEGLPEPVRTALQSLATSGLDAGTLTGTSLKAAVAQSGVFHEAAVGKPAVQPPQTSGTEAATHSPVPADLKTVLFTLRAAVAAWSGRVEARTEPGVPASQAEVPPATGHSPHGASRGPAHPGQPAATPVIPHLPPPTRAITTRAQPAVRASVDPLAAPAEAARTVLADVEGAIGRVTLLQAAALPDVPGQPSVTHQGTRPFDFAVEIPLRLAGHTPVLSLAIGHDEERSAGTALSPAQRAWKMQLSLDLDPAGPLHALVRLRGRGAGVTLWAERPETVSLFQAGLPVLRDALHAADLDVDSLDVFSGAPPQPQPVAAGALLDRRS